MISVSQTVVRAGLSQLHHTVGGVPCEWTTCVKLISCIDDSLLSKIAVNIAILTGSIRYSYELIPCLDTCISKYKKQYISVLSFQYCMKF